jgi:hypothetical protein
VRRVVGRLCSYILHHDNMRAHSSFRVTQFVAGKGVSATDHPRYSPDLASADFWIFPEFKSVLKGKCFLDIKGVK